MKRNVAAGVLMLGAMLENAQGQSGVLLYGIVDVPIEFTNHMASGAPTVNAANGTVTQQTGGNRFAMQGTGGRSGSRWGIRGTEDIGAGLQALFVLESGFGADDGRSQQGGRLFGRQAFIGLRYADYGSLTFGRQYTPMFDTFSNFGPLNFGPLYEPFISLVGSNFREDNMMKYTGSFGPITAAAHFSFGAGAGSFGVLPLANGGAGEMPGAFRDNSAYGGTVSYSSGPFGLAVGYDQWNPAVTTGNSATARKAGVATSYTIGPVKLMGGYRWGQNMDPAGTQLLRDDFYWIGANYQATTAISFALGYYYDNLKSVRLSSTALPVNPPNPWQVTLLTNYAFSKRTDVYAVMAYAKNSGLNFDTSANGFANSYFLERGASNQLGAAVGIRQKF